MTRKLKIAIIVILSLVAVGIVIFIFWPKRPALLPPKNVGGVFPGGGAAYIKTSGVVDLWGSIKETDYYKSGAYKKLYNLFKADKTLLSTL